VFCNSKLACKRLLPSTIETLMVLPEILGRHSYFVSIGFGNPLTKDDGMARGGILGKTMMLFSFPLKAIALRKFWKSKP
jgi:hypothetical protein